MLRPSAPKTSFPTTVPRAANTTAIQNLDTPLLERKHRHPSFPASHSTTNSFPSSPECPIRPAGDSEMELSNLSRKSQWIILAIASGACAALNGVFAKLTTTELTTSFATSIARLLGLGSGVKAVEAVIRAMFFGLNLIFNAVMWALFTKALARGTSTTQVSIINTSSNFIITAILGFLIFTESLPPLWWVGGALLVAGNVIIGRREEKETDAQGPEDGELTYGEEGDGLLAERVELVDEPEMNLKRTPDDDDILDLGAPVDIGR